MRFVLVGVISLSIRAFAQKGVELPPGFSNIWSTAENSALSAECTGSPPFATVDCTFQQMTLSVPSDRDLTKELETSREQFAAIVKTAARNSHGDTRACSGFAEKRPGGPQVRVRDEASGKLLQRACECRVLGDERCVTESIETLAEQDAKACEVWTFPFAARLRRIGKERKWRYAGTTGLCEVALVIAIEETRPGDWIFTQMKIPGIKGGLCPAETTTMQYDRNAAGADGASIEKCSALRFRFGLLTAPVVLK